MTAGEAPGTSPGSHARFLPTHWSMVLSAGHRSSPGAQSAREELCRSYWYPLYAYLRRSGHNGTDAEDLIQSFFARLLEHDWLATADPAKGRFRTFLLVCLKRFVADELEKARALKRGGGGLFVSLDDAAAAERYAAEQRNELPPESLFDRRWALTLMEQAWDQLRAECELTGRLPLFERWQATLGGEPETTRHEVLATSLNLTVPALKSAIFRLRARYRGLLRKAVSQTVRDPREVDDEIRYLLRAVSL